MLVTSNLRQRGSSGTLFLVLGLLVAAAVGYLLLQDDPGPGRTGSTGGQTAPADNGSEAPAPAPASQLEVRPGDREILRPTGRTEIAPAGEGSSGTIFGLVLDTSNLPVRGATVAFNQVLKPEERFFGAGPETGLKRFTKATNKDGRYWFDDLPPGTDFEVWVHHPEYAGAHGQVVTSLPDDQTINVVVLRPGFRVAGTVNDSGGNPLAATVVMQIHGNTFGEEDPAYDQAVGRRIEVQAGPDGRYEVKRLTPGVWKLTASHEGYADYLERALVLNGEETVVVKDVLLGSEFTIAGVVHDDAGRPVPEALVSVARSRPRPPVSSQGVADAEGYFVIRGLPEGVYTVAAEADGFSRTSLPRVEAGSEDLAIVLHKRGSVSGRVTGPDGRPITRFSLELMQVNRAAPTFHQVGAKQQFAAPTGEFLFDNIEPGAYRLLATGPGFSPTYSPGFAVDREEVQGIDVQLSVGGRLTGTLVGPDGLPVSGAEVKVHGRDWTEESSYGLFGGRSPDPNNVPAQVGPTDQDGVFELRNAFPGTLKLEFSHPSFLSEYLVVDVVEGGQQDVGVVKLRRGGSIVGVGIGGDGKALSGGSVFLTRQEETGFGWFSKNGRLDTQGRFRFAGLRTGTYRVVVAPADSGGMSFFPETEMNSRTVYVAEGQEVELRLTAQ